MAVLHGEACGVLCQEGYMTSTAEPNGMDFSGQVRAHLWDCQVRCLLLSSSSCYPGETTD